METLISLIFVYVLLELFEIQWQKADSMMGMLLRMHRRYRQNVLIFLMLHPTYYFAIWLAMVTELSFGSILLLLIKTFDIATKIILLQKVFDKRELSQELTLMLLAPLHPIMPYLGLFIYVPFVLLALI